MKKDFFKQLLNANVPLAAKSTPKELDGLGMRVQQLLLKTNKD
jgi:hypothetical protein